MTSHGDRDSNTYQPGGAAPPSTANCVEKRRAALAWVTLVIPPLAVLAAFGLGLYLNSLTLGPRGFAVVLILVGPGALAIGLACAYPVVEYLARGSLLTKVILWGVESGLCVFAYAQVVPLLGPGWG
jgi:hypothetical protein